MNELSSWAVSVCTVAVICSLVEMLAPEGSLSKLLNFVLGLFLVVSVLLPFVKIIQNGELKLSKLEIQQQTPKFESDVDNLTIAYGKSAVEKIIESCLSQNDIPYQKISISMDSSTGNSIDIIKADVYVGAEYRNRFQEIQDIIKQSTGITPNIYVG